MRFFRFVAAHYSSTETKWLLYITIAFLMSVYNGFDKYNSFAEIPHIKLFTILLFSVLQALIAWRAYVDQSINNRNMDREIAARVAQSNSVPPLSGV